MLWLAHQIGEKTMFKKKYLLAFVIVTIISLIFINRFVFTAFATNVTANRIKTRVSNIYLDNIKFYHKPVVKIRYQGISISSKKNPAGIIFEYKLNPNKYYKLKITGKYLDSRTTLRMQRDSRPYVYLGAPDDTSTTFAISGTKRLQLMFYNDKPYEYMLSNLSISIDKNGKREASLRKGSQSLKAMVAKRVKATVSKMHLAKVQFHNNPIIKFGPKGFSIASTNGSAGIIFEYTLNPNKNYKLNISGKSIIYNTAIRMRHDNGPYVYGRAPDGVSSTTVISNTKHLQIMFYNDKSYKYLLSKLSITPYNGKTDADFKKELLNTIPMLSYNLKHNRLRAADQLANWAANNTLWSIKECAELALMLPSDIYYNFFKKNKGGVYCAGTAVFLNKIYGLFGYNSLTIDIGILGTKLTHVTNFIGLKKNNQWEFYLMDPTFNLRYIDRNTGKYATISKVLQSFKSNNFSNAIHVKHEALKGRKYLFHVPYRLTISKHYKFNCKASNNKGLYYLCQVFPGPVVFFTTGSRKIVVAHHLKPGDTLIFQLMQRKILDISTTTDPTMRSAFINRMKSFGMPVRS